jgi:peptidyl-tRNA hydrolase
LAGLAEVHSNAKMFGGLASDSFKIKWSQINKRGKAVCKLLFGKEDHQRLYVVVRQDIAPGLQIAQSCHSCLHFQLEYPHLTSAWMRTSDYICILGTDNEASLQKLIDKAKSLDIRHYVFIEPDLGNQATAVCFEPNEASKKLCSNLKLALKGL